jgi:mRNA-degrading endonuclease RelE of RelBE toxin-antitoxin system
MRYSVVWAVSARHDIERLPERVAVAVLTYVNERLARNPQRMSKELSNEFLGRRSARNGDYRILFRITTDTIVILRVAHRSRAYRG